jgi:hypothetical protein
MSKICKGTGKAISFGCGKPLEYTERNGMKTYYSNKGLCTTQNRCYSRWLVETDEGQELIIKASKKAGMYSAKQSRIETKEKKKELMTITEYWSKVTQPLVNEIARIIDFGYPCISSGNYPMKLQGGHYYSVGSNRTLSLNLWNIHGQSFDSNHFKSGDSINYRDGLKERYTESILAFIDNLKGCKSLNLTKQILIEKTDIMRKVRNDYKEKYNYKKTLLEIIYLRNEANRIIGIYDNEHSEFKL